MVTRGWCNAPVFVLLLCVGLAALSAAAVEGPWRPDNGDGTYRNPVLFADYSDPDVIRVGDDFYLISSSFNVVPGIPVLQSRDLVNWTIIGHAIAALPSPLYDTPQNGNGVWAPSLRFHAGRFRVYFGDPDLGIFTTTATDPKGPWTPLMLVKAAKGWIDPCPFWDADGSAHLVHAWAKSRVGFNSILTVHRMSADGQRVLDDGVTVFDGHEQHPTIEGPKFYSRNGYYYIFAPAGGVKTGWQTVLRSRHVTGPYEARIVMEQGASPTNGPHQGAWVESPSGASWFVHFQDRGAFGRVVHLQPMAWRDDWPVIGRDAAGRGRGEPVLTWAKPVAASASLVMEPQTSDEFDGPRLGVQWQWNANPMRAWWSLSARPGALRLVAQSIPSNVPNLWNAPNLLLQKLPAPAFTATVRLDARALGIGAKAGLLMMGADYAYLRVTRTAAGLRVATVECTGADKGAAEVEGAAVDVAGTVVELRVTVTPEAACRFSFKADGNRFQRLGASFTAQPGRWIGARVGLFVAGPATGTPGGSADAEWFRIQ